MAITYTWKINSVKVRNEGSNTDAVVQVYWKKIGTDEQGNFGEVNDMTMFTSVDVPEGEFIPFDQLTEATVLGWIRSKLGSTSEKHMDDQIQIRIDEMANPITDKPLPWKY